MIPRVSQYLPDRALPVSCGKAYRKKAQQILAGSELAREQRERTWQLKRVGRCRGAPTDLQVPSSFDRGAGLRNAPQK